MFKWSGGALSTYSLETKGEMPRGATERTRRDKAKKIRIAVSRGLIHPTGNNKVQISYCETKYREGKPEGEKGERGQTGDFCLTKLEGKLEGGCDYEV